MSKEFIKCLLGYMLIMGAVNIDSYFSNSINDWLFSLQSILEIMLASIGIWLIIKYHTKREKIELTINDDLTGIKDLEIECTGRKILTLEDRDKRIKWHLKNDFSEHENEAKEEYTAGYRQCWNWLKDNKVI
jgi:hypothetical protein